MARICRAFTLGDWFLLYQLGKNIDPIIFRFKTRTNVMPNIESLVI